MFEHTFLKGELKRLFDMNQEMKNIFTSYYIFPDTTRIVGDSIPVKGTHFAEYKFNWFITIPDNVVIRFNSKELFDAVNKNKKIITKFIIDNDKIMLYGNDIYFHIGNILPVSDSNLDKYKTMLNNSRIEHKSAYVGELESSDVESLVKNSYLDIEANGYWTKLTRELIPGLKKSHNVCVGFYKHETNDKLFYLIILNTRNDNCLSSHMYTCVHT